MDEEALTGAQEPEQDPSEPVEDAPVESASEQEDVPSPVEDEADSPEKPEEQPAEEAEKPADEEPPAEPDDEPEPAEEESEEPSEEEPDEQPVEEAEEPADEEPPAESDDESAPEEIDEDSPELATEEGLEAAEIESDELAAEEPEEVVEELPPEPDDDRAWHVVHCYSGYEHKVKHNLEQRIETMHMQDRIFQVVIPTEEEIEVKDGKRRTIERRVFPGYILVQMIMEDDSWYVVRNTPGVTGFVGMGNRPAPLRPEEVQAIMKRMEAEAPRIKVTYRSGQKVRIIDGPFNEFIGVVDEIDMERAKVRVLVSFFGRDTPVELDFLQVEKI